MAQQITFYEKNYIDIDSNQAALSVSDSVATNSGQDIVNFLRNRNNRSGWITAGSDDTANTRIIFNMVDSLTVDTIALVEHNFKDYTLEYLSSGGALIEIESVTNNTETTNIHSFTEIQTTAIYLTIEATQTADADKRMTQTIITKKFGNGQLEGYPQIVNPRFSRNRKVSTMLSGKAYVVESLGGFSCQLKVNTYTSDRDMTIFEDFYFSRRSLLCNLSGGDENQFLFKREGYQKKNFFLVRPVDDYEPEWDNGLYKSGIKFSMKLEEVVT